MSGNGWSRLVPAALLIGIAGSACATLHMVPPKALEQESDLLETKGRSAWNGLLANESFALGPYQVGSVKRDSERTASAGYSLVSVGDRSADRVRSTVRTRYSYELKDGETVLPARCESQTDRDELVAQITMTKEKSQIVCTCGAGDEQVALDLDPDDGGIVQLPRGQLPLSAVREVNTAWALRAPAGYRVDDANGPLAAVEILGKGRVWLGRSLEATERRQLTCLLIGLMLYLEPSDD